MTTFGTFGDAAHEGNETAAAIAAGITMAEPHELIPGRVWSVPTGDGYELIEVDPEQFADRPTAKRGAVRLFTANSLASYVADHGTRGTALFGDVQALALVAVLDGHEPDSPGAGWGEHVATLNLRDTPEWLHWLRLDGQRTSQVAFAEHLEDGLRDIVAPSPAELLDVAQTLHVQRSAAFRSAHRLTDGRVQFLYSEDQTATAGPRGELEIPEQFTLSIAPFEGSDPYEITARLRWRLEDGSRLTIGYKLDRPDVVLRTAFTDVLDTLEALTGLTPFAGTPPVRAPRNRT